MEWVFNNDKPIYSQIIHLLKLEIVSGKLAPGSRLPGVRELAMEAGVNPNTMQRAFAELERSGLCFTQRNNGRFVTEDQNMISDTRSELAVEYVNDYLAKMEALGYTVLAAAAKLTEEKENDNT